MGGAIVVGQDPLGRKLEWGVRHDVAKPSGIGHDGKVNQRPLADSLHPRKIDATHL
jgi:hypothetical protein